MYGWHYTLLVVHARKEVTVQCMTFLEHAYTTLPIISRCQCGADTSPQLIQSHFSTCYVTV